MAVNCAGCGSKILDLHYMECSKCSQIYDLECINMAKDFFKDLPQTFKDEWLCPSCVCTRPKGDNSSTPIRSPNNKSNNVNLLRGSRPHEFKPTITKAVPSTNTEISKLVAELRQLRQEITEMKQQNLEIKNHMTSISDNLSHTLNEHTKTLQVAQLEIVDLKLTIGHLQQQIAAREQDSLRNDVEISGITEQANENLYHIVMTASQKIGVELSENDIEDVARVGPKIHRALNPELNNRVQRPIVVKLLRKRKHDELINAAKSRRNLTSENVVYGQPTKIYFNERLTKENRRLFRESRLSAKQHAFRYCWIRNGGIYVRKDTGTPAIRISSTHDLDQKVGPAKSSEENGTSK